jgi:hypothetical protein
MTSASVPLRLRAAALLELKRRGAASDKMTYRIALPALHPLQAEIASSPAKRKVVVAGRRFGKTFMGAVMGASALLAGKRVLIASTSQDQADIFWRYLRQWLADLYLNGGAYKNETKRLITFGTGSIRVKTGSDPDVLRGEDADLLILDECAYLDPDAWTLVGAPMLADRNGEAVFISTPLRRNWFYHLFTRAKADDTGRWAAWHATTFDNPHLSADAVKELAADMTHEAYQQEIMAQFLEGQGAVFRNIDVCATAQRVPPYEGHFVMGVDTAQQQDYTVLTVIDAHAGRMVDLDRFNKVSWESYRGRVRAMAERWNVQSIIFEINSVGSPNFEALANDGLPVVAFATTPQSKPPLIESLALAFERGEIAVLDDDTLLGELGAYERKVSPVTGRSQYSAPGGMHDDCVMSLALAWHGCTNRYTLQSAAVNLWEV